MRLKTGSIGIKAKLSAAQAVQEQLQVFDQLSDFMNILRWNYLFDFSMIGLSY